MHARCSNPAADSYPRYGGRGIRVCDRWQSFTAFLSDMGSKPSPSHQIDRIDGDSGYEPTNCRWALPSTQARNRASTVMVTYMGEPMCLKDACLMAGHKYITIHSRMRRGMTFEQAITAPIHTRRRSKRLQPIA